MANNLSVQQLFDAHGTALQLTWEYGQQYDPVIINLADQHADEAMLIGYLNLVRPYPIQVLGSDELQFLEQLGSNSRQDSLDQLFAPHPAMVIIVDDQPIPQEIQQRAEKNQVPLFRSALPGKKIIEDLRYQLNLLVSAKQTRHGVFMDVLGIGVLLTGPSGIGKSELALELINRGHRLIADDAPEFKRISPNHIRGSCPKLLADFLEVRGLGILNVRAMFGDNALIRYKRLRLIVDLEPLSNETIRSMDRLGSTLRFQNLLDVDIPEVVIPVAPGRNIAVIVEAAVRNHILSMNGYRAADDFMQRQQALIDKQD